MTVLPGSASRRRTERTGAPTRHLRRVALGWLVGAGYVRDNDAPPATQGVFVLCPEDHLLATCNAAGKVTGYARWDPELGRQPEGVTFLSNGHMVTSSAGGISGDP